MSALSSQRRYLSVWLRRLPTDRIMRLSPMPDDAALVTVSPEKSALRLQSINDAAARLGLKPGTALADARAMFPGLVAIDADPHADHALLEAIADWCDRYTPFVGLDPPDGLVLDVTGCAHLFGGEAALCRDLAGRLAMQGFRARATIADTVGGAWAVARYGHASVVARGDIRETILPLPPAALRLPSETFNALTEMGLKRIADIIDRPRSPFAARFGEDLIRRLDQALGHLDEPITPRLPLPTCVAEKRFPDPIAREDDVLGTITHLAHELKRVLERRGEGARLLQLTLFRADGKVQRTEVGTARPLREAAQIRRLFAEKLAAFADEWDPGFGFDMVRLSAFATARLDPLQTGLAVEDHTPDLAHLIDVLGARFGLRRVTRLVPQDTHIPEFAVLARPASQTAEAVKPSNSFSEFDPSEQSTLAPARPLRLFKRPERIEAVAEVPDGPPVRFRWRHVLHEVSAAEGPERIAMEWWRDEQGHALTRDYFRVQCLEGIRVWLYREGLYGRETATPRWFLHGLFA